MIVLYKIWSNRHYVNMDNVTMTQLLMMT